MVFGGIQKLTCLDFPGLLACTVFTKGCNFRCPFCHNASLVTGAEEAALSQAEILSYLKKRRGILEGIVISGGEPLLHRDLEAFLEEVKALGYAVKLDTNGSEPACLQRLAEKKLIDKVAMDIKNAPQLYSKTVGLAHFDLSVIEESKNFLLCGTVDYEFRTTVVKGLHTKQSLLDAARWIQGAKAYFLQGYECRDSVLAPDGLDSYTAEEMTDLLKSVQAYIPTAALRGI